MTAGRLVSHADLDGIRRVLLRRSRKELYYRYTADEVEVLVLWSSEFGERPKF